MAETPYIGSKWVDSKTSVPDHVDRLARTDLALRRVVEVTSAVVHSKVSIVAEWQQYRDLTWETIVSRRGYAYASSFGTRYVALE